MRDFPNNAAVSLRRTEARPVGILDVVYGPGLDVPWHDHQHGYLCLVVSGGFEESWNRGARTGTTGSFFYCPAQLAHRGRYGDLATRVLHLEIPNGDIKAVCPAADEAKVGRGDLRDRLAAGLAWQILYELEAGSSVDDLTVQSLVAEIFADVLESAPSLRERRSPPWVAAIEAILRGCSGAPPGLREIAAMVGRHPSHLARDFRRYTGSTIGQRARRLQVARAAAAIAGSSGSLPQVAFAAGFSDQSHLGRVFKAVMGTTPAAYRRQVHGGGRRAVHGARSAATRASFA